MKLNSHLLLKAAIYSLVFFRSCDCLNLRATERSRMLESWPEWPNNGYNEVEIPIYNNLCKSAWDRYLIETSEVWSRSKAVLLPIVEKYGTLCNNNIALYENMINVVERWEPSWNMASFVQSSVYKDNMGKRRFKSSVVILNDAILMNPASPYFSYEVRMTSICRAIGFSLGLYNAGTNYGTISDANSCMDPTAASLMPSSNDFDLLEQMYFDANNRKLDRVEDMDFFYESQFNQTFASLSGTNETFTVSEKYDEEIDVYHHPINMNNIGDLVKEDYVDGVTTKFYVQDNGDFISYATKVEYDNI